MEITINSWKWAKISAISGIICFIINRFFSSLAPMIATLLIPVVNDNELAHHFVIISNILSCLAGIVTIINFVFLAIYTVYREIKYVKQLLFLLIFIRLSIIATTVLNLTSYLYNIPSMINAVLYIVIACILFLQKREPEKKHTILSASLLFIGLPILLSQITYCAFGYTSLQDITTMIAMLSYNVGFILFFVALYNIYCFIEKEEEEDIYNIY